MTPDDQAELDIQASMAICEAATPDPWRPGHTRGEVFSANKIVAEEMRPCDAAFAIHARTALPKALNELKAARGRLVSLRVDGYHQDDHINALRRVQIAAIAVRSTFPRSSSEWTSEQLALRDALEAVAAPRAAATDQETHSGHGTGTAAGGPNESDCACRGTQLQSDCASAGCWFCITRKESRLMTIAGGTTVCCAYCGKTGKGELIVDVDVKRQHPQVTIRLPLDWMWSGDSRGEPQIVCRECAGPWSSGKAVPVNVASLREENEELRRVGNIALERVEAQKIELAALQKRHEQAALGWAESRVMLNRAETRIAELEEALDENGLGRRDV